MTLPIFPEGSLSESVTTTVWIGVFVLSVFNLRFGWTLSGLVVPGYLVPLMIVKPIVALVIWVEGILAYLIVWSFSQYGSRWGRWSNFFGRDRFYALVLASIGVRVALDGYLFPFLARASEETWLRDLDFASNLHSFGLIIVSLIANQFWKPGLRRGLPPLVLVVSITYLIVRYPLMYFTNFSIGSLEYMYEDIASSMLASPKAYIVLVITALIASRMNLYYSWDFNGILIPSLLALQWYEPLKVLTSFAEAWLIFLVASWVLKAPFLKESTVEGARKILLFFNLSFAYKLCLGHLLVWIAPGIKASDFFGFGYLLPSLMALKMHDKKIPARLTRTTVQASLVGTLAASLVGFGLTLAADALRVPLMPAAETASLTPRASDKSLVEELREDKVAMYEHRVAARHLLPLQREIDAFTAGLRALRSHLARGDDADLSRARGLLFEANYDLTLVEGRYLYIEEREPRRGWGLYVLDRSPRDLSIAVPAPLDEWGTLEAGAYLFRLFEAGALAVYTGSPPGELSQAAEALGGYRSCFHAFHRVFGGRGSLQVRAYTAGTARLLYGVNAPPGRGALPEIPTSMWVDSTLPAGVSLAALRKLTGKLAIEWDAPPFRSIQRDAARGAFAELFLNREDRKRLLARFILGVEEGAAADVGAGAVALKGGALASLDEMVLELKENIAPRGTNAYVPPPMEALLFLDEEVVKPLVHLMRGAREGTTGLDKLATELDVVSASASALGYELVTIGDLASSQAFVLLREKPAAFPRRHWGTYVFALRRAEPFAIEVPHPLYEMLTLEYALSLFKRLSAGYLLIAGAHPRANTDGSADVVLPANKRSLFNLVNQVILRETGADPLLAVQVRALGPKRGVVLPEAEALLSFSDGGVDRASLSPLGIDLVSKLDEERLDWRFVDGSPVTAGYEAQGSMQAQYLVQARNKEFAALWLSPFIRLGYRRQAESSFQAAQFSALGVETVEAELDQLLRREKYDLEAGPLESGFLEVLEDYHRTQDINLLYSLELRWPAVSLLRVIDRGTRKAFLLAYHDERLLPFAMNLTWNPKLLLEGGKAITFPCAFPPALESARRYIQSGVLFLVRGNG